MGPARLQLPFFLEAQSVDQGNTMKILLAIDGSASSLRAVRKTIEFATGFLERPLIVPLHVHRPLPSFRGMRRVINEKDIQRYYREESEKAVKAAVKSLSRAGYSAPPELRVGP